MRMINYLNVLRLLATFSVVLLHTSSSYFDKGLYGDGEYIPFGLYKLLNVWAVPVFIMISGALFLNPNKETGFKLIITKYVRRIVLALILFGLPMCIAETIFTNGDGLGVAFYDFLTGHSWTHMWYLYMLIGLYLLTPSIKAFVTHSSRKTILATIVVLFAMCSVLPTLSYFGISLKSWMTIPGNPYVLFYVLGFYLLYMDNSKIQIYHTILGIVLSVFLIGFRLLGGSEDIIYYAPTTFLFAVSIFLLIKRLDLNWQIANKLNPYCFGIYLVHTVFINILVKILHVSPADYLNPWLSVPILAFIVFLLSLIICWALRLNPILRKYVL